MAKINLNKPVQRRAVLRAALTADQIENRQAEFVISSEAEDTFRTVFRLAGWDLERYNLNPIVSYNHRFASDNPDNILGTSEVFVDGDQLIGRVTFETAEVNPKAEKIFLKIQAGTLRMASITAIPKRGHWGDEKLGEDKDVIYFDEHELYEWAVVDIGSNPDAHKRNCEALDEIKTDMLKDVEITGNNPAQPEKRSIRERQSQSYNY